MANHYQDHVNAMVKNLQVLIGSRVTGIVQSGAPANSETTVGLVFEGGDKGKRTEYTAWILCDPEGNGPGHLDVVRQ